MIEPATRTSGLPDLKPGDHVEVRRFGDVLYRGHIDAVAPGMCAAWVRDHVTGCRAMLHDDVFDVIVLRRGPLHTPTAPVPPSLRPAA